MALPFYNPLLNLLLDGGIYDPETLEPIKLPTNITQTIDNYDINSPSVQAPPTVNTNPTTVNPTVTNPTITNPVVTNPTLDAGQRNAKTFLMESLRPFFSRPGDESFLTELDSIIDKYIKEDYDAETISVLLPQTEPYKKRFAGNQARIAAGLSALSPGEYLQAEEQYNEILKRFNLSDLATRDTFSTLIGGQVSAAELTDRVVNVFDRVRNADAALRAEIDRVSELSRGQLSDVDFARALLTGQTGAEELKRKISIAEITAEARTRNLSVSSAEELQRLGVNREQARAGFETIAQAQPTFEKLAGIYDRQALEPAAAQTELEREVFQGMESQRRKRLAQQEAAAFSGSSGLAGSALSTQRAGQI